MLSYILWNESAELFTLGQFTLRWNGLLLVLGFIIARQILAYIHKKEGKPVNDVDVLAAILILAAALGARLGHVIFYQPQLWSKPLTIFFPFDFKPSFHLTAITGFSIHGAAIGMLVAIWFYARRGKKDQGYLQVLDRISIVATLIAVPVLVGSFLNSEIEGKPTNSMMGTVFTAPVTRGLEQLPCCIMRNPGGKNPLTRVIAKKVKDAAQRENGNHSIALYFFFNSGVPVQTVDEFMLGDVKTFLFDNSSVVSESGDAPLHYAVFKEPNGDFETRVRTKGIARYPVQLFESVAYFFLFAGLFWYWYKNKLTLAAGLIFGLCMIIFWGLRFAFEFLKEDQVSFIKEMGLNKAQILSIPFILLGAIILAISRRKKSGLTD